MCVKLVFLLRNAGSPPFLSGELSVVSLGPFALLQLPFSSYNM